MTTLKEAALAYKPKERYNAADMDFLDINMKLETIEGTDIEGKPYQYSAIIDGNREYYVSSAVIIEIKKILKIKPDATKFKVKKSGSGKSTKYEVEVLM